MSSLVPGAREDGTDLPIDVEHLQTFTLGNSDLEREVLMLFRDQSKQCIDRLRHAADDRAWKEAAHTLKGSASGIGAWAVREASAEVEQLQGSARRDGAAQAIASLEAAVRETDSFIARFLGE